METMANESIFSLSHATVVARELSPPLLNLGNYDADYQGAFAGFY